MAQAHLKSETADYDTSMMRLLEHLEVLQKLAIEAGNADLAAELKTTFDDNLQRYYDAKRAQLEAAMEGAQALRPSRRA